jgi:hypothetical protein
MSIDYESLVPIALQSLFPEEEDSIEVEKKLARMFHPVA